MGACLQKRRFNSMIVRLKECQAGETPATLKGFNSMIVRLKEGVLMIPEDSIPGFNSMIVRLKALRGGFGVRCLPRFQFYDSPIKRTPARYRFVANERVSIL